MRKLFKGLVPILLVMSMVLTLGVEGISVDKPIEESKTTKIETVTPTIDETIKELNQDIPENPKPPQDIPKDPPKDTKNDEQEVIDPPKPAEPAQPTEPTQPADPAEPTEPEVPTDPVDPVEEDQAKEAEGLDEVKAPEEVEGSQLPDDSEEEKDKDELQATASLTINHLQKLDIESDKDELLGSETIEGLQVGSKINPLEYKEENEFVRFLGSQPSELILVEGVNELNLYYEFVDNEIVNNTDNYIPESPDFPAGGGIEISSPHIQYFATGTLGPFKEIQKGKMSLLNTINTGSNTVKNGTTASYPDEVNNKAWPQPGSLKIDKLGGSIAGSGNEFEVELRIEGKNKIETSDIVLVIDRSGSMGSGGRMANAKAAAVSFVNTLLNDPNNTSTRIAIVSFAGDVTVNQQFKGYNKKADLISAINGLNASGGTHIQAGIRQGIAVLDASTAVNKSIVFLGDGAATYSYKPNNPNDYLEDWYVDDGMIYKRTRSDIPSFTSQTVGNGSTEYTKYEDVEERYWYPGGFLGWGAGWRYRTIGYNYYRHGAHAVAEAGFAPSDQNIYTIALGAGTEGDWTLENMANSGYYSTPDPANLEAIYDEIAGSIANAATNAVVTDPLGDMYDILGINGSNYNNLITVSHGNLSWDSANETITWNIGTISQGEVYTMKYKVALDYSAEGGVFYPANKPTYISYKNIDNQNSKKYFPIPEFRLRQLTISKTLINGKAGDGNKEFYITLEGPGDKTWSVGLKPGESKTIKGLIPGNYSVKETVPMNFKATGGSPASLSIGNDDWKRSANVTNKRTNDGWFWHDPDPTVNSFTVGSTANTNSSEPSKNKSQAKLDYFILTAAIEYKD